MNSTEGHAWVADRFGSPEAALSWRTRSWSEPPEGAVLVEVLAAGIGLPDRLMVEGSYPLVPEPPVTPGQEVCGTVVAASAASRFSTGDRILGPTRFYAGSGGFATHAYVSEAQAAIAPVSLSDEEAAGFWIGFRTAHAALVTRAALSPGETVLVLGGSGSTGAASIMLAKAMGARVLAVASTQAGRDFCLGIGADAVIERDPDAVRSEVASLTGGEGCDVVVDPVGGEIANSALEVVARHGRFAMLGFASGSWPTLDPARLVMGNVSVLGVVVAGFTAEEEAANNAAIIALADSGHIRTPLGAVGTLQELPRMLASLGNGASPGKLVVRA